MENTENKKLAYAIRILNRLDVYEERHGTRYVHFYSSMENQKFRRSTVSLNIEEGYVQVGGSMCLPTNGWRDHAAAYRRAEEFIRLSELPDTRPAD